MGWAGYGTMVVRGCLVGESQAICINMPGIIYDKLGPGALQMH